MSALFDMYKVDFRGPEILMGSAPSYRSAALEIELSASRAPGDYAIVDRRTGERTVLSFGTDGKFQGIDLDQNVLFPAVSQPETAARPTAVPTNNQAQNGNDRREAPDQITRKE
jgi:hypothetical protein